MINNPYLLTSDIERNPIKANNIFTNYTIKTETMILIPERHTDYQTLVIESHRKILVSQTPLEIIKSGCLADFSTYEGRRDAVIHHTGFKQKTPIPISTTKGIYAFPTTSPKNMDCVWIFINHVTGVKKVSNSRDYGAFITLSNNINLKLNATYHILQSQLDRTWLIKKRLKLE